MATQYIEPVPCLSCGQAIRADAFTPWSADERLLAADCPSCLRRVILPVAFWEHFSGLLPQRTPADELHV